MWIATKGLKLNGDKWSLTRLSKLQAAQNVLVYLASSSLLLFE